MLLKPTILKKDLNNLSDKWYPSQEEYDPNLTTEDWIALLNDTSIFSTNALTALKRLLHYGGAATCTQLANEYGGSFNFYNKNLSLAAKYVAEKKDSLNHSKHLKIPKMLAGGLFSSLARILINQPQVSIFGNYALN